MQKFLVNSVKMDAKTVSSIMTAVLEEERKKYEEERAKRRDRG